MRDTKERVSGVDTPRPVTTVLELMTPGPACCTPDTSVLEVARMMVLHDCGAIPLVQNPDEPVLVGIVTDRDIVCRLVAKGLSPLECTAAQCMSTPVITVARRASVEECSRRMEEHRIRRLPVVDENGECCGIVSQADLARHGLPTVVARLLREMSRVSDGPSQ